MDDSVVQTLWFRALDRNEDRIRFLQARHEELAAFMAAGHAKFTGEVGVCLATSGPGAIHLLNGLYDAATDHQQRPRRAEASTSRKWTSSPCSKMSRATTCTRARIQHRLAMSIEPCASPRPSAR